MLLKFLVLPLILMAAVPAFGQDRDDTSWMGLDEALVVAQRTERPVLVYVSASWCALCYRVEEEVMPSLRSTLEHFVPAKVRFDDSPEPGYRGLARGPHRWLRSLGIEAPPAFLLLAPDGSIITAAAGFLKRSELAMLLQFVASGSYRSMNLEEFVASADGSP